ncbi:MAG: hypothetical protein KJ698_08125 [Actinobacteria bacterium]|nr:hypothetical protein [Actinomycetota bacterium]MBU1493456.1 hypothetical protein [Actinomycetota bacterium]MBU1866779.1 hypothetical protein [Actinomycetota bacterium]
MQDEAKPQPRSGPLLFARYAYPPNARGYCGPADSRSLLEYGSSGVVDGGLAELAQGFSGAWPYLQLIAAASGIPDPLDFRVVEAYWIGNSLLDTIDVTSLGHALRDRFGPRSGSSWSYLAETIPAGARPHHSFHVFGIYPWVGMLRGEHGDHPLEVLDRCRIRSGQVVSVHGDQVVVRSRPLLFDGFKLHLGPDMEETAVTGLDGYGFVTDLQPGEWVALHWDWVCDRITDRQHRNLGRYTHHHVDMTNEHLAHPGPQIAMS